jgi:hypothetical protein
VNKKLPKIGDLVWCQNGVKKNMGIISSYDPDWTDRNPTGEDYCWVTLIEGSPGQSKWTKLKTLISVKEDEDR